MQRTKWPTLAESIAEDRRTAFTFPCPTCGLAGSRFEYTHKRDPFQYRCWAICPNGHRDEF